jgi:hypothetical protein
MSKVFTFFEDCLLVNGDIEPGVAGTYFIISKFLCHTNVAGAYLSSTLNNPSKIYVVPLAGATRSETMKLIDSIESGIPLNKLLPTYFELTDEELI